MAQNDTKVVTGKVRLSFVNVFDPRQNDNGQDVWSASLLIPKSDKKTISALNKAAANALRDGISSGKLKQNASVKNAWTTLHDGDERDDVDERPEYADHYYMNVSAYRKPSVVDRALHDILDTSEVYSGCYARVSINAYAYKSNGNTGITFGLNHVQKLADGDFLGGRSRAEDDFDALDDEDEYEEDGLL